MNHTLIHFHIPKTAGTTLNHIIKNNYPNKDIYNFGWQPQISLDNLKKLSDYNKSLIKVISGHMTFGLHNNIPK